tara:strand:- start:870 stop:1361 length:492 start_codon:yes stop_codon:yes gene_type:complete
MKKTLLIILLLCSISSYAQEVTTYYLVRHAEKDRSDKTNPNPELTEKGKQRAIQWSKVFKNISFEAIYSTNYLRTLATAEPTAKSQKLEIQLYNPNEQYSEKFKNQTSSKSVLIVGHSNTIPQFVNAILDVEKYPQIKDNNNSNLYVVTLSGENSTSIVLKID